MLLANLQSENSHPKTSATDARSPRFWESKNRKVLSQANYQLWILFSSSKLSLWQKLQRFLTMLPQVGIGDILHSPFHGHGTDVSPPSVQAPGGLLDGVTLCLISTRIWVVQQDFTDLEHGLHACRVLLYVSLQVLPSAKEQRQWVETYSVSGRKHAWLHPTHALSKCCRGWGKSSSRVRKSWFGFKKDLQDELCRWQRSGESQHVKKGLSTFGVSV